MKRERQSGRKPGVILALRDLLVVAVEFKVHLRGRRTQE